MNPFYIIKETEIFYRLPPGSITSDIRMKTTAEARSVAMFLAREFTEYNLEDIADHFNRDKDSIKHNCKKIVKSLRDANNYRLISAILSLRDKLRG